MFKNTFFHIQCFYAGYYVLLSQETYYIYKLEYLQPTFHKNILSLSHYNKHVHYKCASHTESKKFVKCMYKTITLTQRTHIRYI